MANGIFTLKRLFNQANVSALKTFAGVYIIYMQGRPFYVGRSRVSVKDRLASHLAGRGSAKVREAVSMKVRLEFECEELWSMEQAEAQLIDMVGSADAGNLRRETDPADWDHQG